MRPLRLMSGRPGRIGRGSGSAVPYLWLEQIAEPFEAAGPAIAVQGQPLVGGEGLLSEGQLRCGATRLETQAHDGLPIVRCRLLVAEGVAQPAGSLDLE